jgi:hypothetical protein
LATSGTRGSRISRHASRSSAKTVPITLGRTNHDDSRTAMTHLSRIALGFKHVPGAPIPGGLPGDSAVMNRTARVALALAASWRWRAAGRRRA